MVPVAAAIIHDSQGRVLICRRAGGNCAGLWEFPGGKQEPGETAEDCVVRECREELGIEIRPAGILAQTRYADLGQDINFVFFYADILRGTPVPNVHSELRWARPEEMGGLEFCPADVEIVRMLINESK